MTSDSKGKQFLEKGNKVSLTIVPAYFVERVSWLQHKEEQPRQRPTDSLSQGGGTENQGDQRG